MYTLVPTCYRCFISNLALIGQAVSEKIFKYYGDIYVYLGHETSTIYINFHSPFLSMLQMKFGFDLLCCFREEYL